MNGYQLTKQYFAFAAANPGATTPGMCALFMWLVEVNNRSRFTQNFFFNAEDAGYACGMQSRKTVWKYLVQLEVAGLVLVVYKSNNQERPSVLSFGVAGESSSALESNSGGSNCSRWYEDERLGEEDSNVSEDRVLTGDSDRVRSVDGGAPRCAEDASPGDFNNGIGDSSGVDGRHGSNTGVRSDEPFLVGEPSLQGADFGADDGNEQANSGQHQPGNVARKEAVPHDLSCAKNNTYKNTLSVSGGVSFGVEQSPVKGQGIAVSANQGSLPKTKSVSGYSSTETTPKPVITAKTNLTPTAAKATLLTAVAHKQAACNPATATVAATFPQSATPKAAKKTTTTQNTAPLNAPARNAPPLPRRVNTASPALAHSYKRLNYPNQKNSANGAHLGLGAMQEPELTEVSSFFTEHGYTTSAAAKAWAHYRQANWHDVQGRPVLNWQQKCRTIWFTPENRIPTTQTRFVQ
jgi:hypothetical protein